MPTYCRKCDIHSITIRSWCLLLQPCLDGSAALKLLRIPLERSCDCARYGNNLAKCQCLDLPLAETRTHRRRLRVILEARKKIAWRAGENVGFRMCWAA